MEVLGDYNNNDMGHVSLYSWNIVEIPSEYHGNIYDKKWI